MFSSNSFNVCKHCGKANPLNARYCQSCGKPLAVPEEVVVCRRCGKTNSSLSSFCGGCGSPLRAGAETKICPKCRREVPANESVCACGYRFSAVRFTEPGAPAPVDTKSGKHTEKNTKKNGGRIIALISMILLLVFVYFIAMPAGTLRPNVIANWDKGLFVQDGNPVYGYDLVMSVVKQFTENVPFGQIVSTLGIGEFILLVFVALFALTAVIHLLVTIVRLIAGLRPAKTNKFMFIMALINTLWIIFLVVFNTLGATATEGFMFTMKNIFVPKDTVGLVVYAIPLYYWFFTLYSLIVKKKKVKETAR